MQNLETLILWFQKWHEELGELSLGTQKYEKFYFDHSFYPKHRIFQQENS